MGVVYRARDEVLEREVALKLIRPDVAADDEVRHRFLREARLAASINHQGVATLYEAGEAAPDSDGQPQLFFASELVAGKSLDQRLGDGVMPPERVVDLGVQLAEALAAAHSLGIVHRDIKPSNLMVGDDDRLKVLDFGVAKRTGWIGDPDDDERTLTCTARGAVVGTPAYMAPEQVVGGIADARTDIHGAGCVLYQMLCGHAPFGKGSPSEVMRRVIVTPPAPLRTLCAEVPRPLADVVEKALAKEPGDRYQTADELAEALRAAAEATGVQRALRRFRFKGSRRLAVVAALVMIAAVSLVARKLLLGTTMPFDDRDWLLVADVVNETGDEGFTLALKSALETDLRQSRHVNVFDGGRVGNTLKLMRRDPTATIDLETGLEICRFAGVRALLVPQIDAVGDVFILQASLIDPSTGSTADRIRVTAKGREQVLLESIDSLTHQVRRRLGESLRSIAATDPPLVQYTTSSWEALRLLAMGSREWAASRNQEAARCFELALEEDPKFATARGSLGLLYIQFLGREEEGRQQIKQALADASEVSRREYLLLRAVDRQFVENAPQEALADYALVSQLYPDAVAPYNNSGRILQDLGRDEEAVQMYRRAREVDPRNPFPVFNLWFVLNMKLFEPVAAEDAARALLKLQPDSPWARHALAWSLVSQRRFEEAEEAMRAVLEIDPLNRYALPNLAHLLYRRGAYDEAVTIYRGIRERSLASDRIGNQKFNSLCLGLALRGAGASDEARHVLEGELAENQGTIDRGEEPMRQPCFLAAVGRGREALQRVREIESTTPTDPEQLFILAETYTLMGEPDSAIGALERAFEAGFDDRYFALVDPPLVGLGDNPGLDRLVPAS
jgi:tetratricopeptide (TPR) repeat protein/tRNA A-37 threonylcarbamoyl transferase component Bud32